MNYYSKRWGQAERKNSSLSLFLIKSGPISYLLCNIPRIESNEAFLKYIRSTASIATGIIYNIGPYQKTISSY